MTSSRMMKVTVGLASVAMLVSACGGGSDKKTTNGKGVESAFNASLTGVVNPSDKKGGQLELVAGRDFDSLDPGRTYYGFVWTFRRIWDRQMFQYKPAPGKESLKLAPDLAADDGKVSADGLTYTYKLRSGVKFSNGEPVTSQSVKYGIERIFAQDVITGGPTYLIDLLDHDKTYKGPYKDKSADHLGLKTIETPDAQTIVFHIYKPFSDFNYLLALPTSSPVPIAVDQAPATGGVNYGKNPISSGPYKVDSYVKGSSLKMSRNTFWDAKTDPLHKALPDTINVRIIKNKKTLDELILAGKADINISTALQPEARATVLRAKTGKGKYADNPLNPYTADWLNITPKVEPFSNIHCRKAVAYALDKKSIQSILGGPEVGGEIANTVTPPDSTAYEADYDEYPSGADKTGDQAKAKEELKLCGKPSGFATKLGEPTAGFGPQIGLSIKNSLSRVGINVTIVPLGETDQTTVPELVHKQKIGLIDFGWGADFPTDYGYYEFVADSRTILAAGNYNRAEFGTAETDALIDKALTKTGAEQAAIWKEFSHKVMESSTMIPYLYPKSVRAHSPRLTNVYCLDAIFNLYDPMNVGVL
ncbi:MAG: ABC transporter substrate-binding protein [Actinomycetota bacterium]|nr:ABC transporter substrate-binding protein [Actinomycetota bacterium]